MMDCNIGRRGMLGMVGSAAALGLAPAMARAAPVRPIGDSERLRSYMLMRGALDDRLVLFWIRGQFYGNVDGELTPLWGVLAATLTRYRPHPDGGYSGARGEIAYFIDSDTGKVAEKLRNPYTGETLDVPVRGYAPGPQRILPDVTFKIAEHPGATLSQDVTDFRKVGEDVWLSEVSKARTSLPGGKVSHYQEMVTYKAGADEIADPAARKVLPSISFANTVSWRTWMNMGDRPGHMLSAGAGRYVGAIDDLPEPWLEATARYQPDVLKDPPGFLAPVWDKLPRVATPGKGL